MGTKLMAILSKTGLTGFQLTENTLQKVMEMLVDPAVLQSPLEQTLAERVEKEG